MLPSTTELYTNVNKLWKDNDIKHRMEWSHAINNLPSRLNLTMHPEKKAIIQTVGKHSFDFLTKALMNDNIVHPNDRSENNSTERRNTQTLAKYNAGLHLVACGVLGQIFRIFKKTVTNIGKMSATNDTQGFGLSRNLVIKGIYM